MCASALTAPGGLIHFMPPPPSLKDRLLEVMAATGWTERDLIRVSGQSRSAVGQWLGKSKKEIKTIGRLEAVQAIERESGFSALWVAKGVEPKMAAQIDRGLVMLAEPMPDRTAGSWDVMPSLLDRSTDVPEKLTR